MRLQLPRRKASHFDYAALQRWQSSRHGRRILALEQLELRAVLPELFGRHMLQIGNWGRGRRLLASSQMLHCAVLGSCADPYSQAWIELERLPLMTHSVDAILLPHTMEFVGSPHRLLREVDRVLTARGQVIVVGFNPWSVWGLREAFGVHHHLYPSSGRLRGVGRLCDWLSLLDFETTHVRRFSVAVPWLSRLRFARMLAGYVIVARKRVIPMTFVARPARVKLRAVVGASIPLSGARAQQHDG
ncbi:MAG TPA: methyltransferase domain-containing protein [Nevskiaceae bacterium]